MSEDSNKVEVVIAISKVAFNKLKKQLNNMCNNKYPYGIESQINTVEDLIASYVEQMTASEEQYYQIQSKMQEVMSTLHNKGVDMMDVFNSLNEQLNPKQEKEKNFNIVDDEPVKKS